MAFFFDQDAAQKRDALAIFCRAPRLGMVKTRLAQTHGAPFALQLYRAMLADTFDLGSALAPQIETFACFTPDDGFQGESSLAEFWDGPRFAQCEGDLGAKILDCFAQLRKLGYERIVVIGSDSPDLTMSNLQNAFAALRNEPALVFGPAHDGGFYLFGASHPIPESLFRGVRWSQSDTLAAIERNYMEHENPKPPLVRLGFWQDVDDENDLRNLRERLMKRGSFASQTRDFLSSHP